jgi:hypothetical protein
MAKLPQEPCAAVADVASDGAATVPGAGEETSDEQTTSEQTPGGAEAAAPADEHEGAGVPEAPEEQSTDEEG